MKAPKKPLGLLSIEQTELLAFLSYQTDAIVGIKLKTKLAAGLRSDKLVEIVIPGSADPEADSSVITLDSIAASHLAKGKSETHFAGAFSTPVSSCGIRHRSAGR
jgi:hypothetical protein